VTSGGAAGGFSRSSPWASDGKVAADGLRGRSVAARVPAVAANGICNANLRRIIIEMEPSV
jgi:hypothetical protein